jgi:hypothetical protein
MTKRHKTLAISGIILALSLTGCTAKSTEPFKDAPRSKNDNGAPADLVRMPDGFGNAGTKCDHGNRVYTLFHGDSPYGAIAVVPQDPTCVGK